MIIFFIMFSTAWIAGNVYVGLRLIETANLPVPIRLAAWIYLLLSAAAFLLVVSIKGRGAGTPLYTGLTWFGYVGAGFFVFLLVGVIMRDLAYALIRLGTWGVDAATHQDHQEVVDTSKRLFFSGVAAAGIASSAGVATTIGFFQATRIPKVKEVEIKIDGLHPGLKGFRIVQITDTHIGPTLKGDFLQGVVERVNSLNPDLVALTGDFIDGFVDDLREETQFLKDVKARHGLFYCTGNHEYYWRGVEWCEEVARLGGQVLVDEHKVIEHNGAKMVVAGVADYSTKRVINETWSNPAKAKEGAPDHDFSLLLAHQPKSIFEAADAEYDLQLSGHTHGGQFWPWNYFVGLGNPVTAGLHRFQKTQIYVSRGTGYWGMPNRFLVPPEITLITLV